MKQGTYEIIAPFNPKRLEGTIPREMIKKLSEERLTRCRVCIHAHEVPAGEGIACDLNGGVWPPDGYCSQGKELE